MRACTKPAASALIRPQPHALSPDFDTTPSRHGTGSLKWDRYAGRNVIPMWVADMDFPSPPAVVEALTERARHGVFGYTVPPRSTVEAVQDYLLGTHRQEVGADSIVFFPGLVPALYVAVRAFCQPGDEVLTCTPVYPPFLTAPALQGAVLRTVELVQDRDGWSFDFEALAKAVTPRTRVFFLCNPHNPVGRVFPRPVLEELAAFCRRHDLLLCSDEIHCDLILDAQPHTTGLALAGGHGPRLLSMFAPSKTWNLAGLACAFLVIPDPAVRRTFEKAARGLITEINCFGYAGCEAALRHGGPWLQALLPVLRENRDLLEATATRWPRLRVNHTAATYLAWIDARGLPVDNPHAFFEEHGVGLSDGVPFGAPRGFLRLNFGCPRPQLEAALERMTEAMDALPPG